MTRPQRIEHRARRITQWIGRSWARLSYSRFVEPFWLETNLLDLPFPALAGNLDGLRILHLTDFHLCGRVPVSHIRQAVQAGNRQGCDLVALTGDFIQSGSHYIDEIAQMLGSLRAPLGVFAVLGNHDFSVRNALGVRRFPRLANLVTRALGNVGITVLHNESRTISYKGQQLAIAGVADLWSGEADPDVALGTIAPEVFRVVLAHNPRTVESLSGKRCDLMLSGHTHGGQVQWPGIGHLVLSRQMRAYAAGLYHRNDGYLYTNKGIGYTVRFRYNARPEIAVLTIRSADVQGL